MARFREELAWAGGFFCGEGCFSLNTRGRKKYLKAGISQISREVLDRFHAAVQGVGTVYGPYQRKAKNEKPVWVWQSHAFEDVQAVLAMIWPWLSPQKQEQYRAALTATWSDPYDEV